MRTIYYNDKPIHDPILNIMTLSPKFTTCVNSSGSGSLELPLGHPEYNNIILMSPVNEIVLCDEDNEELFRGRITKSKINIQGDKEIDCEGQFSYFNDSIQRPYGTFENIEEWSIIAPNNRHDYAEWLVYRHNMLSDGTKQFKIGQNTLSDIPITRWSTTNPSTRNELNDKLVEYFNCSIVTRSKNGIRYVDFYNDGGNIARQKIEFGVNLLDYLHEETSVDTYTVIIPIGTPEEGDSFGINNIPDGPFIGNVNKQGDRLLLDNAVSKFGLIEISRDYDADSTYDLAMLAANDLLSKSLITHRLEISAIDLHLIDPMISKIRLGEWVNIEAKHLNFNAAMVCVRIDYDLENPDNDKYSFGAEISSLSRGDTSVATLIRQQAEIVIETMNPISQEAKQASKIAEEVKISVESKNRTFTGINYPDTMEASYTINDSYIDMNTGLIYIANKSRDKD